MPDPLRVVLTRVELVEADKHAGRHLTLTGNYAGNVYRTTLATDDPALLKNLGKSLGQCTGETIANIGTHKVDRELNLR